ncbi:hypothetical protein [Rhizobacter sp. OV335]|jgi:hypothetical protein|uniref:hypothetical protein n=1 Tax=Rhizobacter sp. OV335 TaxID=1500264 RepID=UPI00091D96AA|nr:hypothetical protein [Rhizobacter sp. OV335]SHM43185.1 hypothetical protein SAMN02787076_01314 [Rhizobacter sp. OV335]
MTPLVNVNGELDGLAADVPSTEPMQAPSSTRELDPDELRAVCGGPVVQNDTR